MIRLKRQHKRYSRYKDSKCYWLNAVPSEWQLLKLKRVFQISKEKSYENDPVVLSLTKKGIKIRDITTNEWQLAPSYVWYNKVRIWDIVLNPMDLLSWFIDSSKFEGVISPAYSHLRKIRTLSYQYYNYYFQKHYFEKIFFYFWKWVSVDHRWTLNNETLMNFIIVLPPVSEQQQIANYLDKKTSLLDKILEKKKKQIELLKEKRVSLINKAVTKGLDYSVEMKDSWIQWIWEVPKSWGVRKMKYCAELKSGEGITSELIEPQGLYPVYGGNWIRGYYSRYTHKGSFVLIGRQWALCGNINYANGSFWASEHAVVLTIHRNFQVFWLGELLRLMNLNQYSIASAQPGLSVDRVKNLYLPVPQASEQKGIVDYLDKQTQYIDKTILKIEESITLLEEYKTSLISNVVTGKVKVD